MHSPHRWQIIGHDKIGGRVIPKRLVSHGHALAALQNHIDHRVIDRRQHMLGDFSLNHGNSGDTRFGPAIFSLGRERPEFIKLIIHAWHADGRTRRLASKK